MCQTNSNKPGLFDKLVLWNRLSPKRKQRPPFASILPFVDRLLILLVGFDKPLANTNEGSVHEAALQQVMDGFEEQRSALVGQATIPRTILITCETQRTGQYFIISTRSAAADPVKTLNVTF